MKKIVTEIVYNWFYSPSENSEGYERIETGKEYPNGLICTEIREHWPMGDGDRVCYTAVYSDGSEILIFNPNRVYYEEAAS